MNNNPLIVERMIDEKLSALRAEGMRSQMLAHAGLQDRKKLHLPKFLQFFRSISLWVTNHGLGWIGQPGARDARKTLARQEPQNRCA